MFAIATRNSNSDGIRTWDIVGGRLVNQRNYTASSSQVLGASLSADGKWFAYGQNASPFPDLAGLEPAAPPEASEE